MKTPHKNSHASSGFTITELLVSTFVVVTLMGAALLGFTSTMRHAQEGTLQVSFLEDARTAEQNVVRIIQRARAISSTTNSLSLMMPDLSRQVIRFVDGDGDPATLEDNIIEYDRTPAANGDEVELARMVSPLNGQPMFQVQTTAEAASALVAFHVGEVPDANVTLGKAEGYQGVEVRASATPRNRGQYFGTQQALALYKPIQVYPTDKIEVKPIDTDPVKTDPDVIPVDSDLALQ